MKKKKKKKKERKKRRPRIVIIVEPSFGYYKIQTEDGVEKNIQYFGSIPM